MKKIRIVLLSVLMFFSSLLPVFARPRDIDVTHGDIKISVNQKNGSYAVYLLRNSQLGKYEPLFADRKRGTSFLKVRCGSDIFNIMDLNQFKVSCALLPEEDDAIVITYTSKWCVVENRLDFFYDTVLENSYALKSTWKITNKKDVAEQFAVKYILDTLLGEQQVPFCTNENPIIQQEQQLVWPYPDRFIVTPEKNYSLMFMLQGSGISVPSRVVFANWQRLYESEWNYVTVPNRNFSMLPYSVNDSAVCLYWPSEYLDPESSMEIVTVFGNYKKGGIVPFDDVSQTVVVPPVPAAVVVPPPVDVPDASLPIDVPAVVPEDDSMRQSILLKIIDRIDYLLLHPEEVADNELDELELLLQKYSQKKN